MSIGIVALLQWLVKRPIWLDFSVSSLAATCLLLLVSQISESSEFIYISDHTSIRTMEFNDKESRISLGSHLQYITDRREHWSLSEVISSEVDEKFINVNDGIPSLGLTDRTHWFRVALKYQGDEKEVTKAFEIAYPQLETVDFYELDTFGHVRLVQGGTTRPLVAPDVESRNFVSTLHFKQGETKWIYIKVDGIAMLIFPAYLWDINARRHSEKTEMIAFGLYYGIMAVMFLYNLFLYISARFRSYLYYICYIASVSIFMFVNDGLMREFIVGNNPWLNTRLFWLLICLACTTALLFTREFLSIRSRHPKMNAVILLVIGYLICGAILTIIHRSLLSNYIILTGAICCTSSLLASGTVSLLAGYYEAKFFLVAWAFIIVGGTVLTLLFLGVMPVTLYTLHAVHLGSAIEVLLLSFVLADRIKGMASEKLMIEQVGKADLENSVQYLEASQRLKNDFLETISHDFFAPINGVLNRVKLLGATSLNQEQTGFVNTITKSARSMMFLVDDLLMYTEKGDRNTLVSESFDLKEKLEYIHLRYLAKSQFKGLLFTYDVADDVPDRLIGDAAQLHIVLYNLLDNAVKFTERGSVRFKVIRRSFDTKSNQVLLVFRITDTGKGIPLDKQESIFSPFSTIEASSNRNQGGLGISMALCKKIADNMNAEIKLVSKEGAGTEVEFIVAFELGSKDDMRPPLFHKQ